MAYLALFIALGGSSYAAVQLTRNSVKSKHIANGQVKRADLAPKAKVGQPGAVGAQGPQGPPGPKGEPGPPATNADTLDRVTHTTATLQANSDTSGRNLVVPGFGEVGASCPAAPESDPGFVSYINTVGGPQVVFADDGSNAPGQKDVGVEEHFTFFAHPPNDMVTFIVANQAGGVATISIARNVQPSVVNPSVHRCRVQAQAIVSA